MPRTRITTFSLAALALLIFIFAPRPAWAQAESGLAGVVRDASGAAELYVNRMARQIAPVRLTGNYGSEILRRHVAFGPGALSSQIFSPDFAPSLAAAAKARLRAMTKSDHGEASAPK